jgi:hypothetical protein
LVITVPEQFCMAQPAFNDDPDDKPLDPAVEKVRRKLVRFVGINLGLLFVALMAVVGAIVYKTRTEAPAVATLPMTDIPTPAAGVVAEGGIVLPRGATILTQSLSGGRIALDVALADGGRAIFLYDLAERRVIGRYTVTFE